MKYQIGTALWEAFTDGIHAREKGLATNPYNSLEYPACGVVLVELRKAWQDGWDKAEGKISKVYD